MRLSVPTETRGAGGVAISPDGAQLAFSANGQLWVRAVDATVAQPIPGTRGGFDPFWSPDARTIGFFTATELRTIDLAGGPSQGVCRLPGNPWGGTWNDDDVIVFGLSNGGLWQAPAGSDSDPS